MSRCLSTASVSYSQTCLLMMRSQGHRDGMPTDMLPSERSLNCLMVAVASMLCPIISCPLMKHCIYPMRTQIIAFKQYNPFQTSLQSMACSSNLSMLPFTFVTSVYAGKPEGEPRPFYITGSDEIVKHLVSKLAQATNLQ